jgi:hypothetical protein
MPGDGAICELSQVFIARPRNSTCPSGDPTTRASFFVTPGRTQRRNFASFARFSDPDGNGWVLTEHSE